MYRVLAAGLLLFTWCLSLNAQIVIAVTDIPESTPVSDQIYIAGDFQSWDPGDTSYRLSPNADSTLWTISLNQVSGSIEYKYTRGEWAKVESDEQGKFVANRRQTASPGDTIFDQILGWEDLDEGGMGGNSTATMNVSILDRDFYMPQLDRNRRIWLYLPPDYDMGNERYPVIYMHDGQNVFDQTTSFAGEWKVDETMNNLHANGDHGAIIVAIDNGGGQRIDEYTPWRNPQYGGGEGRAYIDFIAETLKPYIDTNYRTLSDGVNTGIIGSSLGGLISAYGGFVYPDVFGKVGAFSPAYWINQEIFQLADSFDPIDSCRIYQLAGSREGANLVSDTWKMHDELAVVLDDNLRTLEKADGQHSEWFWAREFKDCYVWLFGTQDDIGNHADGITISVSPNPVFDSMVITIESEKEDQFQIFIEDGAGRRITELKRGNLLRGANKFQFHRAYLPKSAGTYFIRIETSDYNKSHPVIITE